MTDATEGRGTGATAAQIEAAARRYYEAMPEEGFWHDGSVKHAWTDVTEPTKRAYAMEFEACAEHLVPPSEAIVTRRVLELLDALKASADWEGGHVVVGGQEWIDLMAELAAVEAGDG